MNTKEIRELLLLDLNMKAEPKNEGYAISTMLKYHPKSQSIYCRTYILKFHNHKVINKISVCGINESIEYLENELKMYNK